MLLPALGLALLVCETPAAWRVMPFLGLKRNFLVQLMHTVSRKVSQSAALI